LHRGTYCYLTSKLIQLQQKWDDDHDPTKHIEKNRHRLWTFFSNIVLGIRNIKLFELELANQLNNTWKEGFFEILIQDRKTDVAKQQWIRNSDILLDYIDNEKLKVLNESEDGSLGNIKQLLMELKSGSSFYEKCVNKLTQKEVNKSVDRIWNFFNESLIHAIEEAGKQAKDSPKNCLDAFLKTLHEKNLPSSIKSRLPLTTNAYGSVDDQPRHILDSVVDKLKSVVPNLTSPTLLLQGNESTEILKGIREDAPNNEAKPRCNHACRLCGAPCFKHAGHSDYHDFYHQPAGLMGSRWNGTNLIAHETCHEHHTRKDQFFLHDDQKWHGYDEFPALFNYSVPAYPSRGIHISEYLMHKYHEEIAEFYGIKPNPPVPAAYCEHTLNSIKEDIRKNVPQEI
ncbi:unnamed protein product, partial [Rotaria magnacalcarata]